MIEQPTRPRTGETGDPSYQRGLHHYSNTEPVTQTIAKNLMNQAKDLEGAFVHYGIGSLGAVGSFIGASASRLFWTAGPFSLSFLGARILGDELLTGTVTAAFRQEEGSWKKKFFYEVTEGCLVQMMLLPLLRRFPMRNFFVQASLMGVVSVVAEQGMRLFGSEQESVPLTMGGILMRMTDVHLLLARGKLLKPFQIDRPLELYEQRLFSNLTQGSHGSLRIRSPQEARRDLERKLLSENTNEAIVFRSRIERYPPLANWVGLSMSRKEINVPLEFVRVQMFGDIFRAHEKLHDLVHLVREAGLLPEAERSRLLSLMNFRYKLIFERTGAGDFHHKAPQTIPSWTDDDELFVKRMLHKLHRDRHLKRVNLKVFLACIDRYQMLAREFRSLPEGNDEVPYTISLWSRNAEAECELGLNPKIFHDLSAQVLLVRSPRGEIVGGRVLRLVEGEEGYKVISTSLSSSGVSPRPPLKGQHWFTTEWLHGELQKEVVHIANRIGAEAHFMDEEYRADFIGWSTQLSYTPVTAPLDAKAFLRKMMQENKHPHEAFFPEEQGSYEFLQVVPRSRGVLSPWLDAELSARIEPLVCREIKTNPSPSDVGEKFWGFSGRTGRSVDFYLGDQGMMGPDGVRRYHLSAIGVGKTKWARVGAEYRDGRQSLKASWRRFYLSNLMSKVACDVGFRTSLAVAVTDFQRGDRKGIVYELRREQWRLSDLSDSFDVGITRAERIIQDAKKKVARELGESHLTDADYVTWLARRLGEQFAIMEHFHFDHGVDYEFGLRGIPQLFPWNVSLAGEIVDFGTGRFGPGAFYRYLSTDYGGQAHVSLEDIKRAQHDDRLRRIERPGSNPDNWISVLLHFAPDVDFHGEMVRARISKREELQKLGIDPKQRIRKFNSTHWVPFIKAVRSPESAVPIYVPI